MKKTLLGIGGWFRTGRAAAVAVAVAGTSALLNGCAEDYNDFSLPKDFDEVKSAPGKPALLGGKVLPETYASPDGMALGADGCIYVSITQRAADWKHPAKIARITPDDQIEDFFTLPVHEGTGKAFPMGLVFDESGNLYAADNQSSLAKEAGQSSLFRIVIEGGRAVRAEKVAVGINAANGVARWKDHIYVAEPDLRVPGENLSGVYRFAIADLKADAPVRVTGKGDPRLIVSIETQNKDARGANGLDFDSKGRLYVSNFGDSEIRRYTFDRDNGAVVKAEIFSRFSPELVKTLDGLHLDSEDNIWTADLTGNAILKITPQGVATIVAKNAPSDGADGSLDTPSECLRRGDKLYISNIDLTRGDNVSDPVQTISVLKLDAGK